MKRLEEIAEIIMGTSPPGDTYNYDGVGLPLLNGPTEFGNVYPESTLYTTDSKKECKAGDLIFCVRGNTTGRMNWADKKYSLGRGVCAMRGINFVDTKYIKYSLEMFLPELLQLASGATMPNLTQSSIKQFSMPYPEERNKIATILSAYDDLIENNLRRIKILEEMSQNLYREWFVDFRFPGHENTRFIDSPLGQIPEGWEVVKVGDLLDKLKRVTKIPKSSYAIDGIYPVIDQGKEFIGGYTDHLESIITTDLPLIVFGDHTRVLKYIDFPFARGADGTQLLKSNNKRMPMSLFYYSLLAIDLSSYAYARHFKFLKDERILLPDSATAGTFDKFLRPTLDNVKILMGKNNILRQTRDLLLPKLISGELDVSELDIKVPEEVAI